MDVKQESIVKLLWLQGRYRLAGLVVKASASGAEDLGFESHLGWDFSGSSHTSDLKIVVTLPSAWRYRVSAGTGRPGVSILWLGEVESLICNFYLIVAARKIEHIRPWDTCWWDAKQPTNKLKRREWSYFITPCAITGHCLLNVDHTRM